MGHEVELKLELDPHDASRLASQPLFKHCDPHTKRLISVYYDTSRNKLRKNGLSLRVRSTPEGYVQTVKSVRAGLGQLDRGKWEMPVDSIEPDLDKLKSTPVSELGVRTVRPVVKSAVDRTVWHVESNGALIEAALDEGGVKANGREVDVCEIELELKRGDASGTFKAARRLANDLPFKLGVLSKAERGFALADGILGKVSKAGPVPVRADMDVAEGFSVIARACLLHFRLNEPLVIAHRNRDALHQMRVAMRRLRSALSIFRPALADHQLDHLKSELRWFTSQLGEARNLDVYLQRDLPDAERRTIERRRRQAYDAVVDALGSRRPRLLMIDLLAWISLGRWRSNDKASRPLPHFIEKRISRLWRKVDASGDLREMHDDERHRLRIKIKKLRYALDFAAPLHDRVSDRQKKFMKAVEGLQEALGYLNDLAIASLIGGRDHPLDPAEKKAGIEEAAKAFDRLKKVGPYWTKKA